jgi:hypothetical protein
MKRWRIPDPVLPWSGLIGGVAGLALAHQLGSDTAFDHCLVGSPWIVIVAAVLGVGLAAFGALASWRTYGSAGEGPARKLVAAVSMGAAALFAIVILLSVISSLVIPPCFA